VEEFVLRIHTPNRIAAVINIAAEGGTLLQLLAMPVSQNK
jgi:hypothetical protein